MMPVGRRYPVVLVVLTLLAGSCGPEADADTRDPFEAEVADACNQACLVEMQCIEREYTECVPSCYHMIEFMTPPRPPCDSARLELIECQMTLNCDEFEALQSGAANPCSAEADEVEEICE